ncbi:MAG: ABC transporter permease [Hungatella sp.]|jgi:ABC-2 type transport system permease protein|nr:ABC transporter permease [Hungatella sp.]
MKKYISFFRLRFVMGLSYRAAAWAGIATQFVWGGMEIAMFRAFYGAEPEHFPMTMDGAVSYVWLQQAFLALFAAWMLEGEVFESIKDGNIAYEMCRPMGLYPMLFVRAMAMRVSRAALRCGPVLLFAVLLPGPYGLKAPGEGQLGLFLAAMALGVLVTVAFGTLIYGITFYTISPEGLRLLVTSAMDFFNGAIIPLPFFPDEMRRVMEILPFAAMQNVPLRVYSGDLQGEAALRAVALQVLWLAVLVALGRAVMAGAERKLAVQGG